MIWFHFKIQVNFAEKKKNLLLGSYEWLIITKQNLTLEHIL